MYTGGVHSLHSFIADSVLVTAVLGTDNPSEAFSPLSSSSDGSDESLFSGEANLRDPATVTSIAFVGWNAAVDTVSDHNQDAVTI